MFALGFGFSFELIFICRGRGSAAAALRAAGGLAAFSDREYSISPGFDSRAEAGRLLRVSGASTEVVWYVFGTPNSLLRGAEPEGFEPKFLYFPANSSS